MTEIKTLNVGIFNICLFEYIVEYLCDGCVFQIDNISAILFNFVALCTHLTL